MFPINNSEELFDYLIDNTEIILHDDDFKETELVPIALMMRKDSSEGKEVVLSLYDKDKMFMEEE